MAAKPPIATPDGTVAPTAETPRVPGIWQDAPPIIRSAYTWNMLLMWLFLILFSVIALSLTAIFLDPKLTVSSNPAPSLTPSYWETARAILHTTLCLGLPVLHGWLAKMIRQGYQIGWTIQALVAAVGLFLFPLGTIVYGNILLNWFKPEVRAWFGTG